MKILFLGEYSNVHATLAEGLRKLGHDVTVISNGDFWKNYPRDVDVSRKEGKLGGIELYIKLLWLSRNVMVNYDIVQLINPLFFELKAGRVYDFYRFLKKHNKKIVLGAYGMDYYWANECITRKPLRYSDFNIGDKLRNDADAIIQRNDWIGTDKEKLNRYIAEDCDGIIAGLYEYYVCYHPNFPDKTTFIPFPINEKETDNETFATNGKIKIFIGISRNRSSYKGTDIMLPAAEELQRKYPDRVELRKVEGVSFQEYTRLMEGSDIILDQLYSYTPSMNPLEAMSKGIICVGGGEPENYEILNEKELRPIINVQPNYESVYHELEEVIRHPERIPEMKRQSVEYIHRHHATQKVAKQYEAYYHTLLKKQEP